MSFIDREAFIAENRMRYCEDCDRRRGMKNGKLTKRMVYKIGDAPCRACDIHDMIVAVEDFPEALAVWKPDLKRGRWVDMKPSLPDWSLHKDGMSYYCSECKHRAGKHKHKTYRFCPWCGAYMVEVKK